MEGFTITGGVAVGWTSDMMSGAGMFNDGASPTVLHCVFTANNAPLYGGGMFNRNSSPTLTGCTFSSNKAWLGGGMYNDNSSPVITGCTFAGNTTSEGADGADSDSHGGNGTPGGDVPACTII